MCILLSLGSIKDSTYADPEGEGVVWDPDPLENHKLYGFLYGISNEP